MSANRYKLEIDTFDTSGLESDSVLCLDDLPEQKCRSVWTNMYQLSDLIFAPVSRGHYALESQTKKLWNDFEDKLVEWTSLSHLPHPASLSKAVSLLLALSVSFKTVCSVGAHSFQLELFFFCFLPLFSTVNLWLFLQNLAEWVRTAETV